MMEKQGIKEDNVPLSMEIGNGRGGKGDGGAI